MAEVEGWPVKKLGIDDFPYIRGRLEAQADTTLLFGMFFAMPLPSIAILNSSGFFAPYIGFAIGAPIAYGLLKMAGKKLDRELQTITPPETKKFRTGLLRCTAASKYYNVSGEKLLSEAEQFLNNVTGKKYFKSVNSVYGRTFWTRASFIQANVSARGDGSRLDVLCLDGWPAGNYVYGLLARLASLK